MIIHLVDIWSCCILFVSSLIPGYLRQEKIKNFFTNNPFSCYIVSIGEKYIQVDKNSNSQTPILELLSHFKIHILILMMGGWVIAPALFSDGYFFMVLEV